MTYSNLAAFSLSAAHDLLLVTFLCHGSADGVGWDRGGHLLADRADGEHREEGSGFLLAILPRLSGGL